MKSKLPVVVVAGRANVGKSTLVNRIIGRQVAIVERHPGVTRDRLEVTCDWAGKEFRLIDTGGLVEGGDSLDDKVTEQAVRAMKAADLVLFVLDVTTGVTGEDAAVASVLRRLGDRIVVVANKVDSERREADAWELSSLGLGTPVLISALHGRGVGDLLDVVVARLPDAAGGDPRTPAERGPWGSPRSATGRSANRNLCSGSTHCSAAGQTGCRLGTTRLFSLNQADPETEKASRMARGLVLASRERLDFRRTIPYSAWAS